MNKINELETCLCCQSDDLRTILDLGKQPLANSYHKGKELDKFPLKLNLCTECFHLQLSHAVNPDLMFKDYLYVSGTSDTLRKYFEWFVDYTLTYNPNAKNILDIACNDGTQLNYYKSKGLKTYGIDPAENLSPISKSKGHEIVVDYFTNESIKRLSETKFDLITAQNVFAHNTYPDEFLKQCGEILSDDGYIFIQTSQADMVINNQFDTIYHEHISFFNIYSMIRLVRRVGMFVNDVIKTEVHGNSFVFVISKREKITSNVEDFLNNFTNSKLDEVLTYINYSLNSYKITFELKNLLEKYKHDGYKVVGYGAAAKGNTLLNFGKIKLDLIIDDNPLKVDLLTPGMDIPIKHTPYLSELGVEPVVFVPLAWNFFDEIRSRIKSHRNNDDLFVRYFPVLKIDE